MSGDGLCSCGIPMQPMAHGVAEPNGQRKIVLVCEVCDGPTLETMWGPAADQAVIAAWVANQAADQ